LVWPNSERQLSLVEADTHLWDGVVTGRASEAVFDELYMDGTRRVSRRRKTYFLTEATAR
jgi:hypothetical protein